MPTKITDFVSIILDRRQRQFCDLVSGKDNYEEVSSLNMQESSSINFI